ncbi:hypothetical protein QMK19_33855 [Streptomyces sp. H10-C2]|uniref:hypothetical protein n=1 Tax=unclassified Streptomyces TaxID=2593676 RepID=UPI0024B8FFF4|nr:MULTISPECIES: hypothetical protein [unclassified Streptomyces]MDJ0345533.1 hypothetical protein [Streptomyces sp. PH10-H1]MDJ0374479.1 hypothetical protein [Streptomyces sp. H10-C2]
MPDLAPAQAAYVQAENELRLAGTLAELAESTGLAFRSITNDDDLGPYLVAVDGELVGEVRHHGPGAVLHWRAHPLIGGRRAPDDDEGRGSYVTLRAAAASYLPGHQ